MSRAPKSPKSAFSQVAFDFEAVPTRVRDWPGGDGFDLAPFVSPDGETIFFSFDHVLYVVQRWQVREYPEFSLMSVPAGHPAPRHPDLRRRSDRCGLAGCGDR